MCVTQQSSVTGQSSSEYSRITLSLIEVLIYYIIYMLPITDGWCGGEGSAGTWHAESTGNLSKGSGQQVPTNIAIISADNIVSNPRTHSLWSPP